MSRERHNRIGEIFLAARGLEGPSRGAYLDTACAGDEALREEVQSLLDADAEETAFLAPATGEVPGPRALLDPSQRFVGRCLGRYTLRRVIGSGGMGTVYEAEQLHPRRVVAVKMMRQGLSSSSAVRRFEYESHLLARLRHPAIAQIFDADVYAEVPGGVPYFVMEFIPHARSLTEYIRAEGLPVRRQLELIATVCDAVHHAHQHGVIHRDLKPDNILVTSDPSAPPLAKGGPGGVVKIIDFGVARALASDLQTATMHTTARHLVGTLPYMSPEQAEGDPDRIDARTDVYSLGVILYQLLSGGFPYSLDGALTDVLDRIRHAEPQRLRSVDHRIDDEIETIVLKSLQKEPDRRYQSAGELARDIERYLKGEAIEAKRDSQWYVLAKMARRHRALLGVAAGFVLLVTVSTVALSFMYASQRRERQRAERATVLAEQRADEAERQTYVANIAAADHAIALNDAGEALKSLDQAPQRLRHWEWDHLRSLADRSSFTLPAPELAIVLDMNPDGTRVAIGYASGTVRIWDVLTQRFVDEYNAFSRSVTRLVFDASGGRILAAADNGAWCVFDVLTRQEVTRFGTADSCDTPLAMNADCTQIAFLRTGQCSQRYLTFPGVDVYDVYTHERVREFSNDDFGHRPIGGAAFSADGTQLAVGYQGGGMRVWNLDSGRELWALRETGPGVYAASFNPNGGLLAVGRDDGTIELWESDTGKKLRSLTGHSQRVWKVAFTADGTRLMSVSVDKTARVWNVAQGSQEAVLRGHRSSISCGAWSGEGAIVATLSHEDVKLWRLPAPPDNLVYRGVLAVVESLSFDPSTQRVLVTDGTGVVILDAQSGEEQQRWVESWATYARFGNDGAQVYLGCGDHTVRVVDSATGVELRRMTGHQDIIRAMALSPDGRLLATGDQSGAILLWEAEGRKLLHSLSGHAERVAGLEFSPDSSRLASASLDATVRIWGPEDGKSTLTFGGHSGGVQCVAFAPDGTRVATASADGTFKVWDPATGETFLTVDGKMGDVWAIDYSPDGQRLVTGARDRTVRIWDAETGDELLILRGPTGTVMHVAWSPDGKRIAAGTWNRELFIWDAPPPPASK